MSVSVSASFLKPLSSLAAGERATIACRIQPSAAAASARRKFHLALALDTSGSMAGEGRLDAVKMTLTLLLPTLEDGDVITLIPFNSTATMLAEAVVISPATRITLADQIAKLHANGGTNAESIVPHLRAIKNNAAHPPIDKLFFLTDGEIVEGLTTASGLHRVFKTALPPGTPVDTLGFGADCNARLLRTLAQLHRGLYTFADAAEMLPRIIANNSIGLATEVGRNGILTIPAGWKSLELTATEGATATAAVDDPTNASTSASATTAIPTPASEQAVGILIADKDSWVVLQATGPVAAPPSLSFTCSLGTFVCDVADDIEPVGVAEQVARVDMATVFNTVTETLESGAIAAARAALIALNVRLGESLAKDTAAVIGYMAQVDENLELLRDAPDGGMPAPPHYGGGRAGSMAPPPPGGMRRQNAMHYGGGIASPPLLAPVLSRMHSNTSALSQQQGVFSSVSSVGPGRSATGHINVQFTSRQQTNAMRSASSTYYDHTPSASSDPAPSAPGSPSLPTTPPPAPASFAAPMTPPPAPASFAAPMTPSPAPPSFALPYATVTPAAAAAAAALAAAAPPPDLAAAVTGIDE